MWLNLIFKQLDFWDLAYGTRNIKSKRESSWFSKNFNTCTLRKDWAVLSLYILPVDFIVINFIITENKNFLTSLKFIKLRRFWRMLRRRSMKFIFLGGNNITVLRRCSWFYERIAFVAFFRIFIAWNAGTWIVTFIIHLPIGTQWYFISDLMIQNLVRFFSRINKEKTLIHHFSTKKKLKVVYFAKCASSKFSPKTILSWIMFK